MLPIIPIQTSKQKKTTSATVRKRRPRALLSSTAVAASKQKKKKTKSSRPEEANLKQEDVVAAVDNNTDHDDKRLAAAAIAPSGVGKRPLSIDEDDKKMTAKSQRVGGASTTNVEGVELSTTALKEPPSSTLQQQQQQQQPHGNNNVNNFVTNNNHVSQSMDFYEKSLQLLPQNIEVIIFSDEPQWCKRQKLFESDRFLVSETMNPYVDLCLMTMCDYIIMANSTYSWWGAYLSDAKKIIAPSAWNSDSNTIESKDSYCDNWIKI